MGFPGGEFHGGGAGGGGEERHRGNMKFGEDGDGPVHHDVDDGASGRGRVGGEEGLELRDEVVVGWRRG